MVTSSNVLWGVFAERGELQVKTKVARSTILRASADPS